MVKWLSEDQLQIKDEIEYSKNKINIARADNFKKGILIGLSAFGLVAGTLLGITGATLYAVGQTRVNDIVNTYMASQEFQDEKVKLQEQIKNLPNTLSELEKYYQQGYLKEYEFNNIKNHLEHGINNDSDFDFARRLIKQNKDNEFNGILKENQTLADAGLGLLAPGAGILVLKAFLGLAVGINDKDWGFCGKGIINGIKYRSRDIRYNNMDIKAENKEIGKLKNQYKDLEKRYAELEKEYENNERED